MTSPERRLVDVLEFDLTRCDSSEDSLSDTASCTQIAPRRRLSLVWNNERPEPQAEQIGEQPVQWVLETRVAWGLIRDLARRIGVVQPEDPIPRAIRQQRWSSINVPLMWAAAGGDETTPVLKDEIV